MEPLLSNVEIFTTYKQIIFEQILLLIRKLEAQTIIIINKKFNKLVKQEF